MLAEAAFALPRLCSRFYTSTPILRPHFAGRHGSRAQGGGFMAALTLRFGCVALAAALPGLLICDLAHGQTPSLLSPPPARTASNNPVGGIATQPIAAGPAAPNIAKNETSASPPAQPRSTPT